MYGATSSWNFAVAVVENNSTALPAEPDWRRRHIQAVGIAQVVAQPHPAYLQLMASTQISMRPLPPAVRS